MQFKSFHWLSHPKTKVKVFFTFSLCLFLQNKVGKIYLYFGAFFIKELFHLGLFNMR